jgi:hypothetical protein
LEDRKFELQHTILEHDMQLKDVSKKLEESLKTEPALRDKITGIRSDAILKLHIVDAENLPSNTETLVTARQD